MTIPQKCRRKFGQGDFKKLETLLSQLDPDVGYGDWFIALLAIFHESGGSEDGFMLANRWSSGGYKYKGESDVRRMWRSFKPDHPNPVTIHSLARLVRMQ